jgi:hypothetical protein
MAAGAAVASANTAAATSNAYNAGVAAGRANTAAASGAAYGAGVAAGASQASGTNYAALPAGAMAINRNGTTYYLSGNTWFQPAYGANGLYYTVVPTP